MPETPADRRHLYLALRAVVAAYLLICIAVYVFQSRLIYFPSREIIAKPDNLGLAYEAVNIPTADGTELRGWLLTSPGPRGVGGPRGMGGPRGVVLYCHGNGGNISHRLTVARLLQRAGMDVLLFDYRGYGESPGAPSEQRTYEDAEAAWNFLTGERKVAPAQIIIWGESLGGGVASWLATRVDAAGLVLQSTFTSIADVAREAYPLLPVAMLLRIRYPTRERLSSISEPVLVVHSPQDELIPYHHGLSLYAAAREPKRMLTISGDHNTGLTDSGATVEPALRDFFTKHLVPQAFGSSAHGLKP